MQHLFSPQGELSLARTMARRPLLAFDFDGTLAPIVDRPNDARLSRVVAASLTSLAAHLPVAIVTGRSVVDIRARLGFVPRFIVGNHGAEFDGEACGSAEPSPGLSRLRLQLVEQKETLLSAGVTIEDKVHSLALHYRLAPTPGRALKIISDLLADHDPDLRVFGGRLVINVVSRRAPDKADAVHLLVRRSGAACAVYAGDDANDEPVFAAAAEGWLTIRVGRDDPVSAAQFLLDGPDEVALLLERMLRLLPR